ncbi:MAG TPA: FxLYD domain-containing protein [Pseudomonadales bacterium]|nr:FxLYD domain-containing protein [Pseudomonadales bacterium]
MSDKALALLIAIVVVAVMGTIGVRYYMKRELQVPEVAAPAPAREKPQTLVRVHMTSCQRGSDNRIEMTGDIENVGNVDLHYVTVNVIWKNAEGLAIKADLIYALTNSQLAPGGKKTFHAFTDLTTAARCNAEAVDWW